MTCKTFGIIMYYTIFFIMCFIFVITTSVVFVKSYKKYEPPETIIMETWDEDKSK